MSSRAPGSNSRGRGGKFRKFTRGGGKHFSRDLRPLDADGNEISMWSEDAQKNLSGSGSEEDDSEEEDESEEDSDNAGGAGGGAAAAAAELSREERKKEKKARKDAAVARAKAQAVQVGDLPPSGGEEDSDGDDDDDDMPANPNHSKAARNQAQAQVRSADVDGAADGVKDLSVGGTPSRRERESLEAQQAKEKYRKLHEQGKTDEAKADLARLKVIREKREAEAARKQAEKEAKEAQDKGKKADIEAREAQKRAAAGGPKTKGKKK